MGGYRRHTYGPDIAGPAWLYRLYSGAEVLYVGVSSNTRQRFMRHRQQKPWWPLVDRVEYRWCASRAEAFAEERAAIISEQPRFNVARPKEAVL